MEISMDFALGFLACYLISGIWSLWMVVTLDGYDAIYWEFRHRPIASVLSMLLWILAWPYGYFAKLT